MNALGIISFEDNTANVEGLEDYRPVAAMSFMGRYRIIDFVLSNMTNSGIDNVQVYCKEKPRNLMAHLGDGKGYNINTKRGNLRILYGEKTFSSKVYNHDIANYILNMQYIEEDKNPYVVVAPSYFLYSLDYSVVLEQHKKSGADVTMLYYNTTEGKERFLGCDLLTLNKGKRVIEFHKNRGKRKNVSVSLEAYVMAKETFIDLVNKAAATSSLYWFKDILRDYVDELDIRGYQMKGFVACINSLQEYYRVSMELRDHTVANGLFKPGWPVYTETSDSAPTKYSEGAKVVESVVSNGCEIKGTVEGCVLGRNVTVMEGAVVKDSIILPGAFIGKGANLDHVVVDKYARINHKKELTGTAEEPVYVARRDLI